MSAPSSSSSSKQTMKQRIRHSAPSYIILPTETKVTCRVGELLLPDLLQLKDLLQGLRDLGSTDAHLLVLPRLETAAIECGDSRTAQVSPLP